MDALRIYDYLLPPTFVASLAAAYSLNVPSTPPTSVTYPTNPEDTAVNAIVPTPPIFSAPFSVNPTSLAGVGSSLAYRWIQSDTANDTAAVQAVHQGIAVFDGTPPVLRQPQPRLGSQLVRAGDSHHRHGGQRRGGAPRRASRSRPCSSTGTPPHRSRPSCGTWVRAAPRPSTSVRPTLPQARRQLQFEHQNNVAPGLEASSYKADYYSPLAVNVWYHVVWVLSQPNFSNYSAVWQVYVNGQLVLSDPFALFPLPVYRPLSYLAGSDYYNANAIYMLDAFRIYDYALQQSTITSLANLYYVPPGPSSTGVAGPPGVCSSVSGTTGGDFAVAGILAGQRQPVLNLNFTQSPACATGLNSSWLWAPADVTDSSANQLLHQGVAVLTGSSSSFIDLTTAQGTQSAGVVLPTFGGAGGSGTPGWSIELVVKFPTVVQNLGSCLLLLQDAIGSYLTVVWGNTYDTGDVDVGNRLQAVDVNAATTGLPSAASSGHIEFFPPLNQTWYHMVWSLAPSPSLTAGTGVWSIYINGQLLNYANALVPSSTLTPIQGANFPQASTRTIANLGKDSYTNTFIATVDALRIYDYVLPASTVQSLAGAYSLNIPSTPPTSVSYPTNPEDTAVNAIVPTPPIFSAPFSVNPTSLAGVGSSLAYRWIQSDTANDTAAVQAVHQGIAVFDGTPQSYVNLNLASGPNSCGQVIPIIGTAGSGVAGSTQGLSFETVFKYWNTASPQSSKLWDLGQGGTETIDLSATYTSSGAPQLQFEQQNNVAPGLEASSYKADYYSPLAVNVWYHVVWVLSQPNFSNYSAVWQVYVNGQLVLSDPFALFPLPVYRPLSYLAGSDYYNANAIYMLDAFRVYDYALQQPTITSLANLYYVAPQAGDTAVQGVLAGQRAPWLSLNFSSAPAAGTAWTWAGSDPTDSSSNQALHQGVAVLNGSQSSWINLNSSTGAQSAGVALPGVYGGAGYNGSGWSIELVVKFPTVVQNLGACLFLLQDVQDSWQTIVWGNTYDTGDVDVGNRLQAVISNAASTGLPTSATGGHIEFFPPQNQSWYHLVWTVQPYPNTASGTALWSFYVNGQLLNYANALVPSSTLTPIQGAAYPQASQRTVATLGKDSFTNTFIVTVDALRIYDYLLPPTFVASLAAAYSLNVPSTPPTSVTYPTNPEDTAVNAIVPTPPIFSAPFSVNPTSLAGVGSSLAYRWIQSDTANDTAAVQAVHQGIAVFDGTPQSYVNLNLASGPNSCGQVIPIIGTAGSGVAGSTQGLSFETVFKYWNTASPQSSKLWDLGQGGTETIDLSATYTSSGAPQLQFEQQNNVAPGLEASSYKADYYSPLAVNVWYHVVWVLSQPNFSNYSAVWQVYVNGQLVLSDPFALFPLPVYRPLSYLAGSDYYNANAIYMLDAFRVYDYALQQPTITSLANLYYVPPGPSSTGVAGPPGVCSSVSGTTGGDFAVAGILAGQRQPVLNLNFTQSPACATGLNSSWLWAPADVTDSSANQLLHQGVAVLTGSSSSFIDLTTAQGTQSAGVVLPTFGGAGGSGTPGWSIELVVKFPTVVQNLGSCLLLLQDAIGSYLTVVWGNTYDTGDVDVGNRLQAVDVNAATTGLPSAASSGHIEFFPPLNQTWYHMVWSLAPSPSLTAGTGVWSIYINGQLLNYANALVPSSTLTPIQGANFPQASTRTIANLGKDSYTNTFIATVDALRIYDYVLPASTVQSLAGAYSLNIPSTPPTSVSYPTNPEDTAVNAIVPTPPIFSAPFSVNPTSLAGVGSSLAYRWIQSDTANDTAAVQAVHQGIAVFDGTPQSYVNLNLASGPNSCGQVIPIIGTAGSGVAGSTQGLSFETVFKYWNTASPQSSKLWDLGQGGTETIDLSATYTSSGAPQLQFEQQNNVAPGLEASSYKADYYSPLAVNVWYHVVWVLSQPNFSNYSAVWQVYVNGQLVLSDPFALFPLPVYRPLSYLAGSDYYNANAIYMLDAFRVYDYALQQPTITSLANLYNPSSSTGGAAPPVVAVSSSSGAASQPAVSSSAPSSFSSSGAAQSGTGGGGGSSGLSNGAIAGIVIGSVVGALLILALCFFIVVRGRDRSKGDAKQFHDQEPSTAGQSQHGAEQEVEMGEVDTTA